MRILTSGSLRMNLIADVATRLHVARSTQFQKSSQYAIVEFVMKKRYIWYTSCIENSAVNINSAIGPQSWIWWHCSPSSQVVREMNVVIQAMWRYNSNTIEQTTDRLHGISFSHRIIAFDSRVFLFSMPFFKMSSGTQFLHWLIKHLRAALISMVFRLVPVALTSDATTYCRNSVKCPPTELE